MTAQSRDDPVPYSFPARTINGTTTQRIATLRKRDPVLGAAIDALDLELLD